MAAYFEATSGLLRGLLALPQRGVGRGEPSDRDPVRRARYVVEPDPVEEAHRGGIAAVLPADPQLDVLAALPASLAGELDQLTHPSLVEGLERVRREDLVLEVAGQELPLDVVPGEPERGLGQVVGAEREELRLLGDLVGHHRRPGQLDHRADEVRKVDPPPGQHVVGDLSDVGRHRGQLLLGGHQRHHDLDTRIATTLLHVAGRLDDGRNSWRGGSRRRIVTGRPFIALKMASKSFRWPASSFLSPSKYGFTSGAWSRFLASRTRWSAALRSLALAAAASCSASASASWAVLAAGADRITWRNVGRRGSPGVPNMCSVRHRPIPSAPNWRALPAHGPASAFARTRS